MTTRRSFIKSLGIAAAGLGFRGSDLSAVENSRRPNVILMMVDDLGYGDLSCYGSEKINTPILDNLASEGVKLTSFYAGCTLCTPSRMSLLTGAYPKRAGWDKGVIGFKMKGDEGLNPAALTIAEIFKAEGYRTAMYGKWHLGDTPPLQPNEQGFDDAYYIKRSNNQCKEYFHNGRFDREFDNRRLSETFTCKTVEFLKQKRDKPFFLYLPFTAPHFPTQAHPDWKGKSDNGPYGDVVEELDYRIGEIFKTLEDTQQDKNTIFVFLSDNGPDPHHKKFASTGPFRGLKWSAMEGGYRVPCIVHAPGAVPAERVSGEITSAMDLLPTLTHACGIDLEKHSNNTPIIDGVNVWPSLTGQKDAGHSRSELLYWHGWGQLEAIRMGQWKLFLTRRHIGIKGKGPALFNLEEDPGEKNDLSADHGEKVVRMKARAEQLSREIEKNSIPLGKKS